MDKFIRSVISILLLSILFTLIFFIGNQSGRSSYLQIYANANLAYQSGKYFEALQLFTEALKEDPNLQSSDLLLTFKIGYAFFKTGQAQKALIAFDMSCKDLKVIEDYPLYFKYLCYLQIGDTTKSLEIQSVIIEKFPESPLIELMDSIRVDIAIQKTQDKDAEVFLKKMMQGRFEKSEIYLKILELYQRNNRWIQFKTAGFNFLKRYPFHDGSKHIYRELIKIYSGNISETEFKILVNYLFTTGQFREAKKIIKFQESYPDNQISPEVLEWLNIEIYYRQRQYSAVLDWCLKNRSRIKSFKILREIDLHIARCYLQVGLIKRSIQSYLIFQKRYPNDELSPEVLWKVSWLYEGLNDLPSAIQSYKELISFYKHNEFKTEAWFRMGLDYYRLDNFTMALQTWQNALEFIEGQGDRARILYWIGKCYEKREDIRNQGKIYIDLAARPVDSFYNMKAFYLTSNGGDVHKKINEIFWQLPNQEYSYLPDNISYYQRSLIVKEILGNHWSDFEIKKVKTEINNWPEVYAQGELHERMGNFGTAYRKFRSIFDRHFSDADLPEMIPIFKKLYPFYFDVLVDSAARRFSIPQALILSVIKKESAFEPAIISYANAYGLMQLLPSTASQLAPRLGIKYQSSKQLFDPRININLGSYYLSNLLKRYQGNLIMALGAYNAGPNRMDKWKRIHSTQDDDLFMENLEFEQTRVYVRTCLKYYWIYQGLLKPDYIPDEILSYPVDITEFL